MKLKKGPRGEWFIEIDRSLFLIREDGIIGSDDLSHKSFIRLFRALVLPPARGRPD